MMVIGYELPINKFFKYIFHNLCHRCVSARTVNINIFWVGGIFSWFWNLTKSIQPLKISGYAVSKLLALGEEGRHGDSVV